MVSIRGRPRDGGRVNSRTALGSAGRVSVVIQEASIPPADPTTVVVHSVPRILETLNRRATRPLAPCDLEDVIQDATIVLLGKIDRIRGPEPPGPYIYKVCRLELRNGQRRARRRMVPLESPHRVPDTADGVQQMSDRDLAAWALRRIGGVEAETIRKKHLDGLTFDEIGVRMGVSPNTAKTRYYKGISLVQRMLEDRRRCDRLDEP